MYIYTYTRACVHCVYVLVYIYIFGGGQWDKETNYLFFCAGYMVAQIIAMAGNLSLLRKPWFVSIVYDRS